MRWALVAIILGACGGFFDVHHIPLDIDASLIDGTGDARPDARNCVPLTACPGSFYMIGFDVSCYGICKAALSYADASSICDDGNHRLATFGSMIEETGVGDQIISSDGPLWVAYQQTSGSPDPSTGWVWGGEDANVYAHWAENEPNDGSGTMPFTEVGAEQKATFEPHVGMADENGQMFHGALCEGP